MPIVPEYGPQKVSPTTTAPGSVIQQRGASAATFGAGARTAPVEAFGVAERNAGVVGKAVSRVGNVFNQIAERARTVRAEENLLEYQRERTDILSNPDTGYYNKQGRDAYDGREGVLTELEKRRRQRADAIKDPIAREMFTKATDSLLLQDQQQTAEFSARNFKAWERAVSTQRIEATFVDAARDWHDPQRVAVHLELGEQSIRDLNEGMGEEFIAGEIDTYRGQFYKGVVDSAINSSVAEGKLLLDQFDGYLDANDEFQLKEKLRVKAENEKNQADATLAIVKANNLVNDYKAYPDARVRIMNAVSEMTKENPELADKVLGEALNRLNQWQIAQAEVATSAFSSAVDYLMQPGTSVLQFQATHPQEWYAMTAEQRATLSQEGPVKTNLDLWTGLTFSTPEELLAITPDELVQLQTQLSSSDYMTLVKTIDGLRTGDPTAQVGWSRTAQVSAAVKELYGDSPDYNEASAFNAIVNYEVDARKKALGRDLYQEEFDDVVNGLMAKTVVTTPTLFGMFNDAEQIDISDIPVEDVREFSRMLNERGAPITAENILDLYEQKMNKKE